MSIRWMLTKDTCCKERGEIMQETKGEYTDPYQLFRESMRQQFEQMKQKEKRKEVDSTCTADELLQRKFDQLFGVFD